MLENGRHVQGEELGEEQPAHDREAQRPPGFRAGSVSERDGRPAIDTKPTMSGFSTMHEGQTYPLDDLWKFHERLQGVKVLNQDWRKTIQQFDGPDTLFFIDPPYEKEWSVAEGIPAAEIAEVLKGIQGQWIVAYTNSTAARKAFGDIGHVFTMTFH